MSTNQHKKYGFSTMPLIVRELHRLPDYRRIMGQPFISYGPGNDYGDYLIQLFSRSSTHNTICTGKAGFIYGDGLILPDDGIMAKAKFQAWLNRANSQETYNDIAKKVILDAEIFNGFALLVKRNPISGKIVSVDHLDWTHCRLSDCETKIIYSKNWTYQSSMKPAGTYVQPMRVPNDAVYYDVFDWERPGVISVFYYRHYRPQMKGYPVPGYIGANAAIETQAEIDNYHLNNIKTGFSAGYMLAFFNGVPEENAQPKIERKIKDKFVGSTNAGEIMVTFSPDKEHGVEAIPLRPNDLDKQFEQLRTSVQESIFVGHRVTSPVIFGITTPGALGQRNEMVDAYELFKKTYIQERQAIIEEIFTEFWKINGGMGSLKFKENQPLYRSLSDNILEKIATKNQLLEMVGLPPVDDGKAVAMSSQKDKILTALSELGEDADNFEVLFEKDLCSEDFDRLEEIEDEFERDCFEVMISDGAQKVLDLLKADSKITIETLSVKSGLDVNKITDALIELEKKNIIKANTIRTSGGVVEIEREIISRGKEIPTSGPGFKILTRYRYWGPKDKKNREFCAEMLRMNKLYSREEITNLSNDQGTSVWLYKGGWYHDPVMDVNFPSCRHIWQVVTVKEKIKNGNS